MKISSSAIRRLRTERGWSQDQLAIVSGLSLRTIQRVEAEGIASLGTATSLAATYQVKLTELQEDQCSPVDQKPTANPNALFLGLAIITLANISESGRLPAFPLSDVFASINLLVALVGALILVPSLLQIIRSRQFIGAGLAVVGTPLVTLFAVGGVFASVSGHIPMWQLGAFGTAGIAFVWMALREFRRSGRSVGA